LEGRLGQVSVAFFFPRCNGARHLDPPALSLLASSSLVNHLLFSGFSVWFPGSSPSFGTSPFAMVFPFTSTPPSMGGLLRSCCSEVVSPLLSPPPNRKQQDFTRRRQEKCHLLPPAYVPQLNRNQLFHWTMISASRCFPSFLKSGTEPCPVYHALCTGPLSLSR